MRKIIAFLVVAVILSLVAFMFYQTQNKVKIKKEKAQQISEIPKFNFKTLNGKAFSNTDLKEQASIFIYFNPTCEHCQYEAQELEKQKEKFKNTQVLMFSTEKMDLLKDFAQEYKLDKIQNFKILRADYKALDQSFSVSTVPTILIYNKKQKLVKKFVGETKIEAILKYL